MLTIKKLTSQYSKKIDFLDIEIIIANSLAKTREFVLANPDYELSATQNKKIVLLLERRMKQEPIAHITRHKEFYGLNFIINKHTLVPRPETELMVEQAIHESRIMNKKSCTIIDVGTGSGCIIVAIAHTLEHGACDIAQDTDQCQPSKIKYYATDISSEALKVAKKNARSHDTKVRFLHGDLLLPALPKLNAKKLMPRKLILTANLPYLSKEIYDSAPVDVKKYEPKSALYSAEAGLAHYRKLLKQIKNLVDGRKLSITAFFEISPEQKTPIIKLVSGILPSAKIETIKDLTGRWRICKISI